MLTSVAVEALMPRCVVRTFLLFGSLSVALGAQEAQTIRAPNRIPSRDGLPAVTMLWRVGDDVMDPAHSQFSEILALAADASGRAFVADWPSKEVRVFSGTGSFLRILGREGSGPGEFRIPAAISVAPDGAIFVLDVGLNRITEFDADLNFARTISISPAVLHASRLAVTREQIFVSGLIASRSPTAAVHAFARSDGAYVRSFSTFPQAPSLELAYLVGAGMIAPSSDGGVWHAQIAPYRVRKYSAEGRLLVDLYRDNDFLPPADTAISVTVRGRTRSTSRRPHAGTFNVREIAGVGLVVQIRVPALGASVTDVFDANLVLRHSWLGAPSMTAPAGQSGRFVFTGATADGVPWVGMARIGLLPR